MSFYDSPSRPAGGFARILKLDSPAKALVIAFIVFMLLSIAVNTLAVVMRDMRIVYINFVIASLLLIVSGVYVFYN